MAYTLQILATGDLAAVRLKVLGENNTALIPDADIVLDSVAGLAEETVKDRVTDWATIKGTGTARNKTLLIAATVAAMAAILSPSYPPIRQETFGSVNTSYATESVDSRTARLYAERDLAIGAISTQAASTDHLMAVASIDYEAVGTPQVYHGADL